MKISLIAAIFLIFLIYGCTNGNKNETNLELKTKAESQELNQVFQVKSQLQVGDAPYDFTVVTTEGKAVRLSDFLGRKPVIVYFMATWCPYCARDFAALSKVYKDYENKVAVISISLDLNEDLNLLREYKKKYPTLEKVMFASGQTEILVNYRITRTTTKYAIDKNGKIIYIGSGAFNEEQWKVLLDEMLK